MIIVCWSYISESLIIDLVLFYFSYLYFILDLDKRFYVMSCCQAWFTPGWKSAECTQMSGLVERPWLQLMCCAVCLPHGCNFRWRRESPSGSEYWLVCRHWTPEIEFNESLSLSIIRLVNYSVTTSFIYKLII